MGWQRNNTNPREVRCSQSQQPLLVSGFAQGRARDPRFAHEERSQFRAYRREQRPPCILIKLHQHVARQKPNMSRVDMVRTSVIGLEKETV